MAFSSSLQLSFFLLILPLLLPMDTSEAASPGRALGSTSSTTVAQYLDPQNAVRKQLGLAPLRWSGGLAKYAKWYANQRRKDCAMVHSALNYGENLFWGQGRRWKIADAVAAWAAEKPYYDYEKNACVGGADCYHYTQMVWRNTQSVGCARIACGSGDTYIACEYDPHGNVIGQRPY